MVLIQTPVPPTAPFFDFCLPLRNGELLFEWDSKRYVAFESIPFEPGLNTDARCSLVTVIAANPDVPVTPSWLESYLQDLDTCDVYCQEAFLDGVVITNISEHQNVSAESLTFLDQAGAKWVDIRRERQLAEYLSPGPYLYLDKTLRPVYRLYDDTQGTFLTGLKPKFTWADPRSFSRLMTAGTSYDSLSIAVPPRAPERVKWNRRRLRVAVKDLFRVKGLKTSLNNKSYYEISTPSKSTATVVESLYRNGAHILGMTKLSSMIAREEPLDAVDFHTCFNPRGDGYQSPAGSSSGSAAAVASYSWVDVGIGTDTSGSGRRPAMVNGVWEFRPSHDLIDPRGMVTTYPLFDTPCIFTREFGLLKTVLRSWIPPVSASEKQPAKQHEIIYLLDYLPVANQQQMKLFDAFVEDAKVHLSATVTKLSIRDSWNASHPKDTTPAIDQYLHGVITKTYYYTFYHSSDEFRKVYSETHDGRPPFVIPFVHRRWARGAAVTPEENQEATERLEVYKNWLLELLFGGSREDKEVLVVLPVSNATPNYRDVVSASPEEQSALDELFFQPILGSPDIVVPIGDVPYQSRITERVEYLPVVANVVGAPGRDWDLLRAVGKVLKLSGRPLDVATGSRIFP
ncbi:hypothetical protein QBC32DRAFT_327396 [Pseudoneurospora amorphoporcata]|uniref:Amidase domain-containing protein n=1 Tax=Pseudoneurospora amorphoporcata TaxID=241081 RepID=A0AAN6NQ05_9PEZI|nr:hypothetical protein QBC32DRAFT_327396 [Pseudoneurospora amorphoporcata]